MMKAVSLLALFVLAPAEALACRGVDPEDLKDDAADVIVLTTIKDVRKMPKKVWPDWGPEWVATASVEADLLGRTPEKNIEFSQEFPGSCERIGEPRIGKYYVLYLRRLAGKLYSRAMPYWWAKASGDPRVAKLKKLFPLGPVRAPTPDEERLLDFAEPRVRLPQGKGIENYTRIYARSSPGTVSFKYFPSRTPQRLMLDYTEEMPTRDSCRCALQDGFVDLQDLWTAGKLPPVKR